jgi:hypothetical protein
MSIFTKTENSIKKPIWTNPEEWKTPNSNSNPEQ